MKMRGCIKLYRQEVEIEKTLKDPEFRLYMLFRRLVDWDIRHKETFGTVKATIRSIRGSYLPNWSIGKISRMINHLVKKGRLIKREDGRIEVRNFLLYQKHVSEAERDFQLMEQGVSRAEQTVPPIEQAGIEALDDRRRKLSEKMGFPESSMFHRRNRDPPKET